MPGVVITEEPERVPGDAFSSRHPLLSYVFGDTVRAFYVIGCVMLDLFVLLQVQASAPSSLALVLPPLFAGLAFLSYLEFRVYRWLWPASRRRRIVEMVEGKTP